MILVQLPDWLKESVPVILPTARDSLEHFSPFRCKNQEISL